MAWAVIVKVGTLAWTEDINGVRPCFFIRPGWRAAPKWDVRDAADAPGSVVSATMCDVPDRSDG